MSPGSIPFHISYKSSHEKAQLNILYTWAESLLVILLILEVRFLTPMPSLTRAASNAKAWSPSGLNCDGFHRLMIDDFDRVGQCAQSINRDIYDISGTQGEIAAGYNTGASHQQNTVSKVQAPP